MRKEWNDILIRDAVPADAPTLCKWWNDGAVMAHAGFPNGLGTSVEEIEKQLSPNSRYRHIIFYKGVPIGEMNYIPADEISCEMGIKICESQYQNKGLGKKILSLFISGLFNDLGYTKIMLDTNMNNIRAQHVYEQLGFKKVRVRGNSFKDQLGNWQTAVDYELTEKDFKSYI